MFKEKKYLFSILLFSTFISNAREMFSGENIEDLKGNWVDVGKGLKEQKRNFQRDLSASWVEVTQEAAECDFELMENLRARWKSFYTSVERIILPTEKNKQDSGRKILIEAAKSSGTLVHELFFQGKKEGEWRKFLELAYIAENAERSIKQGDTFLEKYLLENIQRGIKALESYLRSSLNLISTPSQHPLSKQINLSKDSSNDTLEEDFQTRKIRLLEILADLEILVYEEDKGNCSYSITTPFLKGLPYAQERTEKFDKLIEKFLSVEVKSEEQITECIEKIIEELRNIEAEMPKRRWYKTLQYLLRKRLETRDYGFLTVGVVERRKQNKKESETMEELSTFLVHSENSLYIVTAGENLQDTSTAWEKKGGLDIYSTFYQRIFGGGKEIEQCIRGALERNPSLEVKCIGKRLGGIGALIHGLWVKENFPNNQVKILGIRTPSLTIFNEREATLLQKIGLENILHFRSCKDYSYPGEELPGLYLSIPAGSCMYENPAEAYINYLSEVRSYLKDVLSYTDEINAFISGDLNNQALEVALEEYKRRERKLDQYFKGSQSPNYFSWLMITGMRTGYDISSLVSRTVEVVCDVWIPHRGSSITGSA